MKALPPSTSDVSNHRCRRGGRVYAGRALNRHLFVKAGHRHPGKENGIHIKGDLQNGIGPCGIEGNGIANRTTSVKDNDKRDSCVTKCTVDKRRRQQWTYHRSKEPTRKTSNGTDTILQPFTLPPVLLRLKPQGVRGQTVSSRVVVAVHAFIAESSIPTAFHQPPERRANAEKLCIDKKTTGTTRSPSISQNPWGVVCESTCGRESEAGNVEGNAGPS
ncbi:hypothetical protein BJ322DRAFT_835107 [Thelephora terrestris]|uniref:Uncharacterized protein n=1 Tax=Thelephora terrestris TaxID=56493 RepID=A0A9P6L748_9AGAM|nr:hypothetical protein BJ322DRAFT_835107 [Thelephora terrestris]